MNEGRIVSSGGLDMPVEEYEKHFSEEHVQQSNALHSVTAPRDENRIWSAPCPGQSLLRPALPIAKRRGRGLQGGLALPEQLQEHHRAGDRADHAFEEAIAIIKDYNAELSPSRVPYKPGPGSGCHATEAPRGLLYHRYRIGDDGLIAEAKIVAADVPEPGTASRTTCGLTSPVVRLDDAEATRRCEHLIRNYDPCISCATHFLKLVIDR